MATLGNLDPLGRAATRLPSGGPGALEVAMARNKQEDDMAAKQMALQAAAKADKEKEKVAANAKKADLSKGVVWAPHQATYASKFGEYNAKLARDMQAFESKQPGALDPNDISNPLGAQYLMEERNLAQMVKTSDDLSKMYDKDYTYMSTHQGEFMPGAMQALQKEYANPDNLLNGTLVEMPVGLWDLEKNVTATLGQMKFDKDAWANAAGTAAGSNEYILPERMVQAASEFAANPWAQREMTARFEDPNAYTPERRAFIEKLAKDNSMTIGGAIALDMAQGLYGARREERSSQQQTEGGSGARKFDAGVNWLAELTKSVVEGSFKGEQAMLPGIGTGAMGGVTPLGGVQVAEGGKASEEDLKVFDGWTLQKQKAYVDVDGTKKLADNNLIIDKVSYDRNKGEWVLNTTTSGTNAKKTLRFSNEQWESDVYPTLIGENQDKIEGIGGYVNTQQVAPGFEAKNAQNMAGAEKGVKKPAYQTTPTSGKKAAY